MAYNYFHVDAFIGTGLSGNPAGVYLLKKPLSTAQMQRIAAEINLPETSFVWDEGDKSAIRWFTPEREVDLCGHGTLAAAHVMFNVVNPGLHDICFRSASGDLHVKRDADNFNRLSLNFPTLPPEKIAVSAQLKTLLAVDIQQVWQAKSLLVVLESEQQVRQLQSDLVALIAYTGRGVIVTAPGDEVDFVSRYFTLSSNEDPVTGSAHCTLMPYWVARLGKTSLHARQISARGGELFCTLAGERTFISGASRIFLKGEITF
ncbi:TPA: PhzF family phenazine biosynthesis protein [Yersinia enterocolitica]|nr:PhzF family phenazine biosynthesis protein [Yersinia enterocolitica]HEN3570277.1 PhzF family phenazine biosynthesis protein [Yersinia enterocolitica]HEN3575769.1 PhzF family phenazine biosynthesis protein [Yersinia enterocolitica]HEN3615365.1 PhzF family phenazine biosynthesis protein [Yersinia enterocolitica]HEN3651567.1 PhzF family phenazine biosynthesis protein [Yersinia enterocolitica]